MSFAAGEVNVYSYRQPILIDPFFEEFTKLSPSNKNGNNFMGLGLGLYTACRDAKSINGKISVESVLGKGSTFTLILPVTYSEILI